MDKESFPFDKGDLETKLIRISGESIYKLEIVLVRLYVMHKKEFEDSVSNLVHNKVIKELSMVVGGHQNKASFKFIPNSFNVVTEIKQLIKLFC
jgi:hypothetical protein